MHTIEDSKYVLIQLPNDIVSAAEINPNHIYPVFYKQVKQTKDNDGLA